MDQVLSPKSSSQLLVTTSNLKHNTPRTLSWLVRGERNPRTSREGLQRPRLRAPGLFTSVPTLAPVSAVGTQIYPLSLSFLIHAMGLTTVLRSQGP